MVTLHTCTLQHLIGRLTQLHSPLPLGSNTQCLSILFNLHKPHESRSHYEVSADHWSTGVDTEIGGHIANVGPINDN